MKTNRKAVTQMAMGAMAWLASLAILIAAVDDDSKPIFDGKTLEGWHCRPESQAGNWKVEDGVIVGSGKGQES